MMLICVTLLLVSDKYPCRALCAHRRTSRAQGEADAAGTATDDGGGLAWKRDGVAGVAELLRASRGLIVLDISRNHLGIAGACPPPVHPGPVCAFVCASVCVCVCVCVCV